MDIRYAYAYVRVSTDKQEELSPASQEKLLREYAKKNNIIILEVFSELGISGRKADKRPAFQRMIALSKSADHPVDLILVWKFSRFARNQEESIVYKSLLKKQHNVDVVSISEPLIDGPFGSLIERIIEWMDEYYSIRLSGEVLRGMKEKAFKGGYQTAPCLGYKALGSGEPFVIDEEEFKIVKMIFTLFDDYNKDYTTIARHLNQRGYLTRRGIPFEARGIERIVKNPFYYGLVIWNGYAFTGAHEVRYTKEQFDARMDKIHKRYRPTGRKNISACKHWLSGLLKCGVCGASLSYGYNTHSPGFQCYRYSKGIHENSCFISEKKMIAAVYEYFENLLVGMDFEYEYRTPAALEESDQLAALMEELGKIDSRESRIRLAYENGIDTIEEYRDNKNRILKARQELEEQLHILKASPAPQKPSKEDVLSKVRTVYDMIKNPEIDYDAKGTLMRSLIEDIVVDKKNNQIIFHLYIS